MNYVLEVAQPLMCVPAVLRMMMRAEGCAAPPQVDIANSLGLVVPSRLSSRYPVSKVSEKPSDWGVHVAGGTLDRFFSECDCQLREVFVPVRLTEDWEFHTLICGFLSRGAHVVVGVDAHRLMGVGVPGEGHVLLVEDASNERDIRVMDPGPRDPGSRSVRLDELYEACRARNDGVWGVAR